MGEWTSRSVDWEKVKTLSELLEREGHLEENIAQHAEEEKTVEHIRQQLIEAKRLRQSVQRQVVGEKPNVAFWCQSKHALKSWVNLKEMLNNARGNQKETLRIAPLVKQAEHQVGNSLILVRTPPTKDVDCPRCEEDMKPLMQDLMGEPKGLNSSESQGKSTQSGNNPGRGGRDMVDLMDALAINGGVALGKLASLAGQFADMQVTDPVVKPSTLVPVLGLGIQAASLLMPGVKNQPRLQLTGLAMGSNMLVNPLVDMAAKALLPETFGMSSRHLPGMSKAAQSSRQFIPPAGKAILAADF